MSDVTVEEVRMKELVLKDRIERLLKEFTEETEMVVSITEAKKVWQVGEILPIDYRVTLLVSTT